MKESHCMKYSEKTSFSAFLPNFGNISAKCRIRQSVVSAKCLFGKVVFGEVSRTLPGGICLFLTLYITQVSGERLQDHWSSGLRKAFWPLGYKTFFMISSAETKIYPAHKS